MKILLQSEIIEKAKKNVSEVLAEQSRRPREYVKEYDKFMYLIDGRAEQVCEK